MRTTVCNRHPISIAGTSGAVVRGRGEGEQDARLRSAVPDHLAVERQQARPLRSHTAERGKIPLHYRQRDICNTFILIVTMVVWTSIGEFTCPSRDWHVGRQSNKPNQT